MSVGGIIGGVVGGVAGFFLSGGNPLGAAAGFSLGMGVGTLIDPIDMNSNLGAPEAQTITAAGEGGVIAEILGTTKIQGNIIWYEQGRTEQRTQEVESGKGGSTSQEQVVGYDYYASWAVGICMGEADALYSIWEGDDAWWSGVQNNPGTGLPSEIVVEGRGTLKVYWGTSTQTADPIMGDDALAYRNVCFILFDDFLIGQSPRVPSLSFIVKKTPEIDGFSSTTVGDFDYNPASALYYVMNTMVGVPEKDLERSTFTSAAETLNTESSGISMLLLSASPALTICESILRHIDGHMSWGVGTTTTTTTTTTSTTTP